MASNPRKELLNGLAERAFGPFAKFLQVPDVGLAERRGERLGLWAYALDGKHRRRTIENLGMAFPEWKEDRIRVTAQEVYRHFGRVTGDFVRSPLRTNEEVLAAAEVVGYENFELARAQGKGILMCTGHFGNWERYAHFVIARGYSIAVVARDANQGGVQAKVLALREQAGSEVLSRGNAARQVITRLRAGGNVGILPDQNDRECFIPFFGIPAGTVLGPGVLHQRTGAPALFTFCSRIGVGRYECLIEPPILAEEGLEPEELMRRFNLALERAVRRHPEQYLWLHDRWKNARRRGLL